MKIIAGDVFIAFRDEFIDNGLLKNGFRKDCGHLYHLSKKRQYQFLH